MLRAKLLTLLFGLFRHGMSFFFTSNGFADHAGMGPKGSSLRMVF